MDSGPDCWRGGPGADPPPGLASPTYRITFDSCETPSAPSLPCSWNAVCTLSTLLSGVGDVTRAPKACPLHALAHLIAAKPCRCPAFDRSWEGLYAIKRAGFGLHAGPGRQVGWKPQRLRSYQVFCQEKTHANRPEIPRFRQLQPIRNLAAYLIAYKPRPRGQETQLGAGFVRYQMCGFWAVWSSTVAGLIAAKLGLKGHRRMGPRGFCSYQM